MSNLSFVRINFLATSFVLGSDFIRLMRTVACVCPPSCSAGVAVVAWCLARVTIPASATYPLLMGGTVKRATDALDSMHACAQIFLRGFLAVGSNKHRMFAVLLWALRVHSTSAAARFSSACHASFYFSVRCMLADFVNVIVLSPHANLLRSLWPRG